MSKTIKITDLAVVAIFAEITRVEMATDNDIYSISKSAEYQKIVLKAPQGGFFAMWKSDIEYYNEDYTAEQIADFFEIKPTKKEVFDDCREQLTNDFKTCGYGKNSGKHISHLPAKLQREIKRSCKVERKIRNNARQ